MLRVTSTRLNDTPGLFRSRDVMMSGNTRNFKISSIFRPAAERKLSPEAAPDMQRVRSLQQTPKRKASNERQLSCIMPRILLSQEATAGTKALGTYMRQTRGGISMAAIYKEGTAMSQRRFLRGITRRKKRKKEGGTVRPGASEEKPSLRMEHQKRERERRWWKARRGGNVAFWKGVPFTKHFPRRDRAAACQLKLTGDDLLRASEAIEERGKRSANRNTYDRPI